MDSAARVRTLRETVCISHSANNLDKNYKSNYSPSSYA